MYNLRYHIASLVAVFLALAVGLLLGTIVAEPGTISSQTEALIAGLQTQFDEITTTNRQLETSLARDQEFGREASTMLTAGLLNGATVMVVVPGGRTSGVQTTTEWVTSSGGMAPVATVKSASLGLDKSAPKGLQEYFAARGIEMAEPGDALITQVADALVVEWRTAGERPLTGLLTAADVLAVDAVPAGTVVTGVIALGDGTTACDPFVLALARSFGDSGPAVGVDSGVVENGPATACADADLGAIDHLGSPQGRVALVYLLAGRAEGYYGFGDAARAAYPPLAP